MQILEKCTNPVFISKTRVYACGQCPECRRRRMQEWALRGHHQLITEQGKATFITLTYKQKNLRVTATKKMRKNDKLGTLCQEDVQLFLKRFRKKLGKDRKIKYIYCGEYGEVNFRPHYHMILFGIEPNELTKQDYQKLWKLGHVDVSNYRAGEKSIYYTLRYVSKKIINTHLMEKIYTENGRKPPYLRCSKGIGKEWALKKVDEWCETLTIGYKGYQQPVPRYYIKTIKKMEGKRFKPTITRKWESGKTEERKEYNFIENINGKYTAKINKKSQEIYIKRQKKWLENNKKIITDEIKKQIKEQIKDMWSRYKTIDEKYYKYYNLKESELNQIFSHEVPQEKKKYGKKIDIPIELEVYNKLQSKAKAREYDLLNGIYGKRDKYEKMELLYGTND